MNFQDKSLFISYKSKSGFILFLTGRGKNLSYGLRESLSTYKLCPYAAG